MTHTDPIAAFRAWYDENAQWLVTQPFTEFIAVAAWKAGRAQALEDAAKACRAIASDCDDWDEGGIDGRIAAGQCADAIRAL
jgi:predicted negative regulator of RcsB-dependent stress response